MIAYYFRVMDEGEPTGWYGTVFAQSRQQLFWVIDEFTDPYSVEVKVAKWGGYCMFVETFTNSFGDEEIEESKVEYSDHSDLFDDKGWKKPNWEGCGL